MKKLMILVAVVMVGSSALAEQIVLVVQCRDGQAQVGDLESKLRAGWRVVSAVPVQDSNSLSVIGKAKQAYTASIVYVLERQ